MTPRDLRAARKALGYTQHQLAEALRMGAHGWQSVSRWERDGSTIPGPVQVAMEHLAHCKLANVAKTAPSAKPEGPSK